jgi:dihydrofolate reductase
MRAIVAMDPNRVIGYRGKIPWHIPEDFKFFKQMTMGCPLVMGRSTFLSIGYPLPGRFTYILTNDPDLIGMPKGELCQYVNKDKLFEIFNRDLGMQMQWNDIWVCGGAKVYADFMPYIHRMVVTHLADEYEGDTYMPEFEKYLPYVETVGEYKDYIVVKHMRDDPLFLKAGKIKFVV